MVVRTQAAQMVYRFSEVDASMADLLGGKGSNLCEMTRLGLPVPPGFVITTQVCRDYLSGDYMLPEGLADTLRQYDCLSHSVRVCMESRSALWVPFSR